MKLFWLRILIAKAMRSCPGVGPSDACQSTSPLQLGEPSSSSDNILNWFRIKANQFVYTMKSQWFSYQWYYIALTIPNPLSTSHITQSDHSAGPLLDARRWSARGWALFADLRKWSELGTIRPASSRIWGLPSCQWRPGFSCNKSQWVSCFWTSQQFWLHFWASWYWWSPRSVVLSVAVSVLAQWWTLLSSGKQKAMVDDQPSERRGVDFD